MLRNGGDAGADDTDSVLATVTCKCAILGKILAHSNFKR